MEDGGWQDGPLSAAKTAIAQLTCRLFVTYSGADSISNVLVSVKVPDAVTARQTTICIPTLGAVGLWVPCVVVGT
jgi:hypothetical protein